MNDGPYIHIAQAAAVLAVDNARLHNEARRRQAWLEAATELTRGLLTERDVGETLTVFARQVRRFTGSDLAVIALADPDAADLPVAAADGDGAEELCGVALPTKGTLVGAAYESGRVQELADASADTGVEAG